MLSKCGIGEDSWETLDSKEIKPVNPIGNKSWIFIGRTGTEAEASIPWPPDAKSWLTRKDPDSGKYWGRERANRIWDGWMASLTQWTWVWAKSGRWWRTGNPGMLQFMGLQRVRYNLVIEQQQATSVLSVIFYNLHAKRNLKQSQQTC